MPRTAIRPIRTEGKVAFVTLTRGREAIIDADDIPLVAMRNWQWYRYAQATIDRTTVYMHRLIAETPPGMETDHINGDKLDNRRENLRWATRAQNSRNTGSYKSNASGYKGVTWHKGAGKWQVQIRSSEKRHYLGLFDTPEDAAAAYAAAAERMHGEFARTS